MLCIIFGPPRVGKTCFMTYMLNEVAFDYERNKLMREEIAGKIEGGFDKLTIPTYSVACNYEAIFRKFGYSPRPATVINPYKLGFWNKDVPTHFLPPYTTIGITEAQKYFDSRKFKNYPEWQSRFYEAHGHNHLDIYLDCQRPGLIDLNIRELAEFIEIVDMTYKKGRQIWKIRRIDSLAQYEAYIASGKQDKNTYKEETVKSSYDVFNLYDSRCLKPLFYAGHTLDDFDRAPAHVTDNTLEGYVGYMREHLDELPKGFYKR